MVGRRAEINSGERQTDGLCRTRTVGAGWRAVEIKAQATRQSKGRGVPASLAANLGRTYPNGGNLVNAAFLLVSSALLVGQTTPAPGAKPGPAPGPAPVTSAPAVVSSSGPGCTNCGGGNVYGGGFYGGGCCDTGCNDCCSSSRHGRFRGLFSRHNRGCDSCFDTCNSCCGGYATYTSGCNSCNDCCGSSSGGLFGRFRGLFSRHHNSGCCDTGCYSGCGNGCAGGGCAGVTPYAPGTVNPTPGGGGEVIGTPPTKMPKGTPPAGKGKDGAAPKEVRINNAPVTGAPIAPATPNIEVAPPAVPNLDADRKEPF